MSFANDFDDDLSDMSEINMTPLVDVMLVLLIIFMIAVPVLTHSVKVDLPQATSSPTQEQLDTITISVQMSGEILWNEAAITRVELEQRLVQAAQKKPQPNVHIRGDKKVEYDSVLQVMTAVQNAGLQKIGFISKPSISQPAK